MESIDKKYDKFIKHSLKLLDMKNKRHMMEIKLEKLQKEILTLETQLELILEEK